MGKPRPKAKLCPGKAKPCPGNLKDNNNRACPGKLKKNWALKFTENVDTVKTKDVVHDSERNESLDVTPLDYSMRSSRKDVDSATSESPQVCISSPSPYGVSSQPSSDATSSPELKVPLEPYFPASLHLAVSTSSPPQLLTATTYSVPPPGHFTPVYQAPNMVPPLHVRHGPMLEHFDHALEAANSKMEQVSISRAGPNRLSTFSGKPQLYQQQGSPPEGRGLHLDLGILMDAAHAIDAPNNQSAMLYGNNFNGQQQQQHVNPGMGFDYETLPRERSYSSSSSVVSSESVSSGSRSYYKGHFDDHASSPGSRASGSPSSLASSTSALQSRRYTDSVIQGPGAELSLLGTYHQDKAEGKASKKKKDGPYRPSYLESDATCKVCRNDKATGFHYSKYTCEGCKGFFRRAVQKKLKGKLKCKNEEHPNKCPITKETRTKCQSCRFRQCIRAGMKEDMVLNDAQRIAKNKLKENNRRKRAAKEMEEGAERIENLLGPEHHTLVHYATAALVHMRSSLLEKGFDPREDRLMLAEEVEQYFKDEPFRILEPIIEGLMTFAMTFMDQYFGSLELKPTISENDVHVLVTSRILTMLFAYVAASYRKLDDSLCFRGMRIAREEVRQMSEPYRLMLDLFYQGRKKNERDESYDDELAVYLVQLLTYCSTDGICSRMSPEAFEIVDNTPVICARLAEYYTGAKRSHGKSEATNCSQMDMVITQTFKENFTKLAAFRNYTQRGPDFLLPHRPSIVLNVVQALKDADETSVEACRRVQADEGGMMSVRAEDDDQEGMLAAKAQAD